MTRAWGLGCLCLGFRFPSSGCREYMNSRDSRPRFCRHAFRQQCGLSNAQQKLQIRAANNTRSSHMRALAPAAVTPPERGSWVCASIEPTMRAGFRQSNKVFQILDLIPFALIFGRKASVTTLLEENVNSLLK